MVPATAAPVTEPVFEAAGVAVFALTGALVAARKGMDPFGFILLGTVTGVGGGTLRDLVLGRTVFWVQDPSDVLVCSAVALAAWFVAYSKPGVMDGWGGKSLLHLGRCCRAGAVCCHRHPESAG